MIFCDRVEEWNPANFSFTLQFPSFVLISNTDDSPTIVAGIIAIYGSEKVFYALLYSILQKVYIRFRVLPRLYCYVTLYVPYKLFNLRFLEYLSKAKGLQYTKGIRIMAPRRRTSGKLRQNLYHVKEFNDMVRLILKKIPKSSLQYF